MSQDQNPLMAHYSDMPVINAVSNENPALIQWIIYVIPVREAQISPICNNSEIVIYPEKEIPNTKRE